MQTFTRTTIALLLFAPLCAAAQTASASACPAIAIGADVSFLPQAEAAGKVFRDEGAPHPALEILRHHGYNWVRLRLFNHPATLPNDLSYTLAEAKKAKALGFGLLLDLHYSDDWADPAHQLTPVAWQKLSHPQLVEAVYSFTHDTIAQFRDAGVMPDIVQVGNEITSGMLWPDGKLPENWNNFTDLLKAGVRGVADGSGTARKPKIMLHIDQGGNSETTQWFFSHVIAAGVPFDIIGQSYYPWWQGSIADLKSNLAFMAYTYRKPIVIAETAFNWQPSDDKDEKKKIAFPATPEGQRDFLAAVSQTVASTPNHLGRGVFWWEPAVSGALSRRGLFDDQGNALPAIHVFDACMHTK